MTILEHIKRSIASGMLAKLEMYDGIPGVRFLDEHEFIPFDDLNYNEELGYFQISQFPDALRECTNAPVSGRNVNRGTPGRRWAVNEQRIVGYVPEEWVNELVRLGKSQSDAIRAAIDIALHPMEHESEMIRLADPLPCGIRSDTPSGTCGKPAYVAHANRWRNPALPGHWVVLPVCRGCVMAAAKVYGIE